MRSNNSVSAVGEARAVEEAEDESVEAVVDSVAAADEDEDDEEDEEREEREDDAEDARREGAVADVVLSRREMGLSAEIGELWGRRRRFAMVMMSSAAHAVAQCVAASVDAVRHPWKECSGAVEEVKEEMMW